MATDKTAESNRNIWPYAILLSICVLLPWLYKASVFIGCLLLTVRIGMPSGITWHLIFPALIWVLFPIANIVVVYRKQFKDFLVLPKKSSAYYYIVCILIVLPLVFWVTQDFKQLIRPLVLLHKDLLIYFIDKYHYQPISSMFGQLWYPFWILVIAFFDELYYRVFVFKIAKKINSRISKVIISAFIYSFSSLYPIEWLQLFLLGLVTGWSYDRYRSIWICFFQRVLYLFIFYLIWWIQH